MPEPISAGTLIALQLASSGIQAGSQFFGGQAQGQALTEANRRTLREQRRARRLAQQQFRLQQQLIAEQAPLRAAQQQKSLFGLDQLQQFAESPVGESIRTQNLLTSGQQQLLGGLSRAGLSPDSSAFGLGIGRLTSDVLGQAESERLRAFQFLAGQRPESLLGAAGQAGAQGAQFASLAGQLGSQSAQIAGQQGAVQGSQFGGIGQTIGQIPLNLALLNLLGGSGTPMTPGQSTQAAFSAGAFTPGIPGASVPPIPLIPGGKQEPHINQHLPADFAGSLISGSTGLGFGFNQAVRPRSF